MKKIVIVENDRESREHVAFNPGNEGYETLVYETAKRAFEDIKNGLEYDLLITDLSFSDRGVTPAVHYSGEDIISISSTLHPEIPVIYVSGYPTTIPGAARLKKPFDPNDLLDLVKNLLQSE